jgi:hypothetical protein
VTEYTYESRYGFITVGEPRKDKAIRLDQWVPKRDPHEHSGQYVLCSDSHDHSRQYDGPYVTDCPSCWLGFPHTEAKHQKSLTLKRMQEQGK